MSRPDNLHPLGLGLGLQLRVTDDLVDGLLHLRRPADEAMLDIQMFGGQLDVSVLLSFKLQNKVRQVNNGQHPSIQERQAPLLAHLVTAILAQLQTLDDLPVDEVSAVLVFRAVVPRGEDLLAEEEPPGGVLLLLALFLHLLLALGDGIHQVLPAAAQSPDLREGVEVGGSAKRKNSCGETQNMGCHSGEVIQEGHHLLIHGDIEGEAKGVAELDLLGQRLADFPGGGCRVH